MIDKLSQKYVPLCLATLVIARMTPPYICKYGTEILCLTKNFGPVLWWVTNQPQFSLTQ